MLAPAGFLLLVLAGFFFCLPRPSYCGGLPFCHGAWPVFTAPRPAPMSRPAAPPRRPASNKPYSAEKSTAVWLAIWRIWAGFANSQLRRATFRSNYSYKCPSALLLPWSRCSDRRKSVGPSAPIAYATSVSPPNEAVAWLWRRCWVLDEAVASQGRRCWVANNAASCPWHTSCKSPRARILVIGTSGAHWPARWPQFVLTERVAKS